MKDSVDSYSVHSGEIEIGHENLENCIVYDAKEKKCRRCETEYKMS